MPYYDATLPLLIFRQRDDYAIEGLLLLLHRNIDDTLAAGAAMFASYAMALYAMPPIFRRRRYDISLLRDADVLPAPLFCVRVQRRVRRVHRTLYAADVRRLYAAARYSAPRAVYVECCFMRMLFDVAPPASRVARHDYATPSDADDSHAIYFAARRYIRHRYGDAAR